MQEQFILFGGWKGDTRVDSRVLDDGESMLQSLRQQQTSLGQH